MRERGGVGEKEKKTILDCSSEMNVRSKERKKSKIKNQREYHKIQREEKCGKN